MSNTEFEVIIVGGSYAGLSAGLIFGRSLRRVLILDSGKPCNRQSPHSHGFLTRDGETPARLNAIAKDQLLHYPTVTFQHDTALTARKNDDTFHVSSQSGATFTSNALLLATGVIDQMPSIKGFAECWGISVLHCPYCHGYEVRGEKLGVMANGPRGFEFIRRIYHWSNDLTVFTNGASALPQEQSDSLRQQGVTVVEDELVEIEHADGRLHTLMSRDGTRYHLDALFAAIPLVQHSDLSQQLGCAHAESGLIVVDDFGRTSVEDVYAAGDNSSPMRHVVAASANGAKAAAWINNTLIEKSFS